MSPHPSALRAFVFLSSAVAVTTATVLTAAMVRLWAYPPKALIAARKKPTGLSVQPEQ